MRGIGNRSGVGKGDTNRKTQTFTVYLQLGSTLWIGMRKNSQKRLIVFQTPGDMSLRCKFRRCKQLSDNGVVNAIDDVAATRKKTGFFVRFLLHRGEVLLMCLPQMGENSIIRAKDGLQFLHFARFRDACLKYGKCVFGL